MSRRSKRMAVLLTAIEPAAVLPESTRGRIAAVAAHLDTGTDLIWLSLAVLRAQLPTLDEVIEVRRQVVRGAAVAAVEGMLASSSHSSLLRRAPDVRVLTGVTIVDVHHTARTRLATGIQRVVRKAAQVWDRDHEMVFVGWTIGYKAMRELSAEEKENTLHGSQPHSRGRLAPAVTVPWKSTYILPELAIEADRTDRIAALAEYSGNRTVVVGYDCVPFTTAETTAPGMAGAFARNLTSLMRFDRVAAISRAAAAEYSGWKAMLPSIGIEGPDVQEILLAAEPETVSDDARARARETLIVDDLPMLLCVGSHEPRKNHLAVVWAAEMLWEEGHRFSLTFVGGNSWGSERFKAKLAELQGRGLPIQSISAISDDLLWSAYKLARCTVFPSLNEGFGLPVAESLSVGTPVVTSRFGSMAEIAEQGGAILVDPRDDLDVLRGIRSGLFDEQLRADLLGEAAARGSRTWAEYATELWAFAHGAVQPH